MRRRWQSLGIVAALVVLAWAETAHSQAFSSGSTGADGPFAPPSNTTLTLPASGVFNFTTITIPSGVTVTIARNALNTAATLLATGDITIAGTLDLNGGVGGTGGTGTATFPNGGPPGPGGFAGGSGSTGTVSILGGTGLGPGGGASAGTGGGCGGAGAGHNGGGGSAGLGGSACPSGPGGASYGTATLLPPLGGSGGSGGTASFGLTAGGGGGGGGALLLASSTRITVTGTIRANGGNGGNGASFDAAGGGGGGSGGAIRLVAPVLAGSGGSLQVAGGSGGITGVGSGQGGSGAPGRIRLEASTFSLTATMTVTASQGSYGTPDVTLPAGFTNPVTITLAAAQIPVGTGVTVRSTPLQGSATSTTGSLTGTTEASTATLTLSLPTNQPTVLAAEATFALLAREGPGPLYVEGPVPRIVEGPVLSLAEGEEVTHVRVAAVFGGPSQVTYLTRSGREIVAP